MVILACVLVILACILYLLHLSSVLAYCKVLSSKAGLLYQEYGVSEIDSPQLRV